MVRSPGPRPGPVDDGPGELVDGQLGVGQRIADGRDDLVGLPGVNRTGSGCIGADEGSADSAPVHIGRSAVGSRCTVPRGPNVLTSVRSSHSARCMSARVAPAMRRPIESSAALRTWACAPHSAPCEVRRPHIGGRLGQRVAGHPPGRHAEQVSSGRARGLRGHEGIVPGRYDTPGAFARSAQCVRAPRRAVGHLSGARHRPPPPIAAARVSARPLCPPMMAQRPYHRLDNGVAWASYPGGAMDFYLLGPFDARVEGRRIAMGRRQERRLLGLLLLEPGRVVPLHRLLDLLWDGEPPARARAAVHTYVARLRARLAPHGVALVTQGEGYVAEVAPERVDAHRFAALVSDARASADPLTRAALFTAALSLWRGPLLADSASEALRERVGTRLRELRLTAVEGRAEANLAAGRAEEAIADLAEAVEQNPTREGLVGLFMIGLYRQGRPADALTAYHAARQHLIDELGIEPGPDLRRLYERILRNDPTLAVPEPAGSAPPPSPPTAGTVPAQLPLDVRGFTGRRAELGHLDRTLHDPQAGPTAVRSPRSRARPGVGKTALAVHWAHRVPRPVPRRAAVRQPARLRPGERAAEPGRGDPRASSTRWPCRRTASRPTWTRRSACYRSLLAGRRMLMVLDNARDADQVRPLLPGTPGCLGRGDQPQPAHRPGRRRGRPPAHPRTCCPRRRPASCWPGRLGAARVAAEPAARRRDRRPVRPAAAGAGDRGRPRRDPPGLPAGDAGRRAARRRGRRWTRSPAATRSPTCGRCSPGPTSALSDAGGAAVPAARPAPRARTSRRARRPASPASRPSRPAPLLAELARAHLLTEHAPGPVHLPRPAARLRRRAGPAARPGRRAPGRPAPAARPLPAHRRTAATGCSTRTGTRSSLAPPRPGVGGRAASPTYDAGAGLVHRRAPGARRRRRPGGAGAASTPTPGSWAGR